MARKDLQIPIRKRDKSSTCYFCKESWQGFDDYCPAGMTASSKIFIVSVHIEICIRSYDGNVKLWRAQKCKFSPGSFYATTAIFGDGGCFWVKYVSEKMKYGERKHKKLGLGKKLEDSTCEAL
ncbi:hypothetical protein JTB14_006413 [Gonioctena quinquepunctata]|nr:hypothetical protein JTB14_006413 [Gonioctena quinquepunctata]